MKICGHDYKVLIGYAEDKKRKDDVFYFGYVDFSKALIHIRPDMSRTLQEESLVHELVHVLIFHTNQKGEHNEQLTNALANGLCSLGVGKLLWKLAKPKKAN